MSRTTAEQTARAIAVRAWGPPPWNCWRCAQPIESHDDLDAGHIIDRSHGGTYEPSNLAPEHRTCNRTAGGRLGAQRLNALKRQRTAPSRQW